MAFLEHAISTCVPHYLFLLSLQFQFIRNARMQMWNVFAYKMRNFHQMRKTQVYRNKNKYKTINWLSFCWVPRNKIVFACSSTFFCFSSFYCWLLLPVVCSRSNTLLFLIKNKKKTFVVSYFVCDFFTISSNINSYHSTFT